MHDRTPDAKQATGPAEEEAETREDAPKATKFADGAIPKVQTGAGAPASKSASDQAFDTDPGADFRDAIKKRAPTAITIAGKSPAAIGALLAKDPALAAEYFEVVAANRSDAYREPLKALFSHLTLGDKKKLFSAQYGFAIVERPRTSGFGGSDGGEFQPDQIDKMYEAAALLPPAHMTGNPKFKKLEAGDSATFYDKKDTIEMPSDKEASTGIMEAKYSSAFRHEVGHAVDFALGDKTNKLRDEFGWHVISDGIAASLGRGSNDKADLAAHFEQLGVMKPGLEEKDRLDLASALAGAISGGDDYMTLHLTHFHAYEKQAATDLIARGVTPLWKERKDAFYDDGLSIGDQHYFGRGYGNGGAIYRVKKSTYDAAPEKGKVSHFEWFAEWYAKYYETPGHAGVPDRLGEFFRDEVDPFNQQRSTLGGPNTTEGTGGETPRHM